MKETVLLLEAQGRTAPGETKEGSMLDKRRRSRRNFLAASGSAALVSRLAAAGSYYDVPVFAKSVEKAFKIPGCKEPNDLQFAPDDTLWVLDQVDPNKVFRARPEDGSIVEQ